MDNDMLYLVDLTKVDLAETDGKFSSWVHALAPGEYKHPVYGDISVTPEKVKGFSDSVKLRVRGIDPSINYKHDGDGEAAGWVKDAEARTDGLWVFVEWTAHAAQKIKDKAYRYFSAEYHDIWKDAQGNDHKHVLFGGALTNRPYMKNLVPVNLSESVVDTALGLAEAIVAGKKLNTGTNSGGEVEVDLKKLNEMLGLSAETTEADALAKLTELLPKKPDNTFPTIPGAPELSSELRALAEDNPLVATLLNTLTEQQKALKEHHENLLEREITTRLSEFDQSKIILTPKAKDMVHDLLVDMPVSLHESFWNILKQMRQSNAMMVELGERSGATVKYGRARDAKTLFMSEVDKTVLEKKISLAEAMAEVAASQPSLYEGYRRESYIGATE